MGAPVNLIGPVDDNDHRNSYNLQHSPGTIGHSNQDKSEETSPKPSEMEKHWMSCTLVGEKGFKSSHVTGR